MRSLLRPRLALTVLASACTHIAAPSPARSVVTLPTVPSVPHDVGCAADPRPLAAFAVQRAASCVVRGANARVEEITVTPREGTPFVVRIAASPAVVRLGARGDSLEIDVATPLAFHGTTKTVSVQFERAATLEAGLVQVARGVHLRDAFVEGGLVRASLTVGDISILNVAVRCEALGLSAEPTRWPPESHPRTRGWRSLFEGTTRLFADPGSGASISVEPFFAAADRVDARGFVHIVAGDASGSVQGWVPRSLVEWTEDIQDLGGVGEGGCGCGCTSWPLVWRACLGSDCPDPRDYDRVGFHGSARILAGATVYAEPGRGAWATAPNDVNLDVDFAPGGHFVRIEAASGISDIVGPGCNCDRISRAWVPREQVGFP